MFSIDQYFSCFIGDILVFMPGQEDIEVTCELLAGVCQSVLVYLSLFIKGIL